MKLVRVTGWCHLAQLVMRLLTHNSLKSHVKDAAEGYPLKLTITKMAVSESPPNPEFIKGLMPSLEWKGVLIAAEAVGVQGLPAVFTDDLLNDESFLVAMHNLLIDVFVETGTLTCPDSGREFQIVNGIPNMIVPEDQVK